MPHLDEKAAEGNFKLTRNNEEKLEQIIKVAKSLREIPPPDNGILIIRGLIGEDKFLTTKNLRDFIKRALSSPAYLDEHLHSVLNPDKPNPLSASDNRDALQSLVTSVDYFEEWLVGQRTVDVLNGEEVTPVENMNKEDVLASVVIEQDSQLTEEALKIVPGLQAIESLTRQTGEQIIKRQTLDEEIEEHKHEIEIALLKLGVGIAVGATLVDFVDKALKTPELGKAAENLKEISKKLHEASEHAKAGESIGPDLDEVAKLTEEQAIEESEKSHIGSASEIKAALIVDSARHVSHDLVHLVRDIGHAIKNARKRGADVKEHEETPEAVADVAIAVSAASLGGALAVLPNAPVRDKQVFSHDIETRMKRLEEIAIEMKQEHELVEPDGKINLEAILKRGNELQELGLASFAQLLKTHTNINGPIKEEEYKAHIKAAQDAVLIRLREQSKYTPLEEIRNFVKTELMTRIRTERQLAAANTIKNLPSLAKLAIRISTEHEGVEIKQDIQAHLIRDSLSRSAARKYQEDPEEYKQLASFRYDQPEKPGFVLLISESNKNQPAYFPQHMAKDQELINILARPLKHTFSSGIESLGRNARSYAYENLAELKALGARVSGFHAGGEFKTMTRNENQKRMRDVWRSELVIAHIFSTTIAEAAHGHGHVFDPAIPLMKSPESLIKCLEKIIASNLFFKTRQKTEIATVKGEYSVTRAVPTPLLILCNSPDLLRAARNEDVQAKIWNSLLANDGDHLIGLLNNPNIKGEKELPKMIQGATDLFKFLKEINKPQNPHQERTPEQETRQELLLALEKRAIEYVKAQCLNPKQAVMYRFHQHTPDEETLKVTNPEVLYGVSGQYNRYTFMSASDEAKSKSKSEPDFVADSDSKHDLSNAESKSVVNKVKKA